MELPGVLPGLLPLPLDLGEGVALRTIVGGHISAEFKHTWQGEARNGSPGTAVPFRSPGVEPGRPTSSSGRG
jgi:hypothetical protein